MSVGKLIERLLQLIPVLLGVSVIVFVMMLLTPGDPVEIMLGDQHVTEEQEQALRHDMGLDRPVYTQYWVWLGRVLQGQFGRAYFVNDMQVEDLIWQRFPATLELAIASIILTVLISVPAGVLAAAGATRQRATQARRPA